MKQLVQRLKSGEMSVLEVPSPALASGSVLVRTHFSLISTGSEGRSVRDARRGYLGKARAREKEVKQVLQSVKQNGLFETYGRVMNRLEAPSPLGYSCAGQVIAVGSDVTDLGVGDYVACGGNGAVHAEAVAVPRNLCVRICDRIDLRHAAFTTIGAIALQGVRRADLGIGSNCLVIGLGLVGLLSMQLLEAAGVVAIGVDIDPERVDLARRAGARLVFPRNSNGLEDTIVQASRGNGVDAVIISASTNSTDPVELAGRVCRQKGRVVVVGNVPTGFSRQHYYHKELDLRMSCSYGPGRYDPIYEERGIDYPIGYVRWTENRNMQAFVDLLEHRKIDVESLITHTFPLDRATEAYDLILGHTEPLVGVLLEYDTSRVLRKHVGGAKKSDRGSDVGIGFVGAGSFAKNVLLPAINGRATLVGVATGRSNNARHVADRFGFAYCTGDADYVLSDDDVNVVFIATRHDLHAPFVVKALKAGKHVFVEKPLCLTAGELEQIERAYAESTGRLMVGFNRRFAPQIMRLKASLPVDVPKAINYRINAGGLGADHWVHDTREGGGRIIGEVCHFIDLTSYIVGGRIISVSAQAMADPHGLNDTLVLNMGFSDGSTAAISYFSNGSNRLPKERLEVFSAGQAGVLDDFRTLRLYGEKKTTHRLRKQDKGHVEEVTRFLSAIKSGDPAPIAFDQIVHSTQVTFGVLDSLRVGQVVTI